MFNNEHSVINHNEQISISRNVMKIFSHRYKAKVAADSV